MRNLNFVVFYTFVFIVFGLVISVFYGDDVEGMSVDELRSIDDEPTTFLGFLGGIGETVIQWLGFLFRALTLDIPGIPWYLRGLIVTPLHVGIGYIIINHIPFIGGSS